MRKDFWRCVFERRFSKDSFACRTGFGTHQALARAKQGVREFPFVLKCDVRKYFASIDHAVLRDLLADVIKCQPTLRLAARVIDGSKAQEDVIAYFPGDDLFTPFERRMGLPPGNQKSQFFANGYVNPLDQRRSREELDGMREEIVKALAALRLDIHPRKSRVQRTTEGVTFLGWRLFPERTRLVRENVVRFRRRMRALESGYALGEIGCDELRQRVRAWIAHAAHGDTWRLRKQVFGQFAFRRGSAV